MTTQSGGSGTGAAGRVALLGVPLDENSSMLRGGAQAPGRVREVLFSGSSSDCSEDGTRVLGGCLHDAGDVAPGTGERAMQEIERRAADLLDHGSRVLAVGGDHSVTWPLVRAHASRFPGLAILQFDAHPDLYDDFEGNRLSHASPLARIMEAGLAKRLVQVGIRSTNAHLREQVERFQVEQVTMREFSPGRVHDFGTAPVYVTFDLDALDPAFAPGVSHHEPGGLSVRDVLHVLERTRGRIVGADIVELNPLRDPLGVTAAVAAKLVKELAARLARDAGGATPSQPMSRDRN
jgi:arginase